MKEMVASGASPDAVAVARQHFASAVEILGYVSPAGDNVIPVVPAPDGHSIRYHSGVPI